MLFNSLTFLIFLPVVFLLYWKAFGRNLRLQNCFVVLASYIFYGYWDWHFLILIAVTTLCSYVSGLLIEKYEKREIRRVILWANVVLNLAILCCYKYFDFFADNFAALLRLMGMEADSVSLNLILPVGISFYTFQALSYTIDVYRKDISAAKDPIAFFAFISFFPQLVAGPIERATNLLPQFLRRRCFDNNFAEDGCWQILWGFFKKVVVADNCAMIANQIFGDYHSYGSLSLLAGAIFFTFQIYGDFSGYSDIAIGVAKLFGINLMQNFKTPYFSRDIAEFWRRWHISLTTWFRDYIYIPLGGSRCKRSKVARNTLVIFLVSGLWHGAEWTFVAWGAYHAVLFLPSILTGRNRRYVGDVSSGRLLPTFSDAAKMSLTFILVLIGWILFRADNIQTAWSYLKRLFSFIGSTVPMPKHWIEAAVYIIIMVMIEWITRDKLHGLQFGIKSRSLKIILATVVVLIIEFTMGASSDFIYFQF